MYASLVSAGASALYDLYKSATDSTKTSSTSSTTAAFPSTSSGSTSATGSTDASTIGAVGSTSTSGSRFSDALQKLFTDLQASTTASTDQTSTVANDLQSLSKGLKSGGNHGHHHGPAPTDDSQSASTDSKSTGTTSSSSASNPFQGLASSLVAYTKTQNLGAATSTSLTA